MQKLILGGQTDWQESANSGDVLQYDEYTKTFDVIGELIKKRSWHSMTVVSKDQFLCLMSLSRMKEICRLDDVKKIKF